MAHQAVSRRENGESIPEVSMLDKLFEFYKISIGEILQKNSNTLEPQLNQVKESKRRSKLYFWLTFIIFSFVLIAVFAYMFFAFAYST